jgi:hypothetical protein
MLALVDLPNLLSTEIEDGELIMSEKKDAAQG